MAKSQPEPWLRGTHVEIPPVPRAVIHALELAQEDLATWCADLTEQELAATPSGLPSVTFQLRHISRSVERLLTYAEGNQLNARQLEEINTESKVDAASAGLLEEVRKTVAEGSNRIRKLGENSGMLYEPRTVGRKNIPTTVAGLLIHVAESHAAARGAGDNYSEGVAVTTRLTGLRFSAERQRPNCQAYVH